MNVEQIAAGIEAIDPAAKHYDATAAAKAGEDFTVWMEYERTGLDADDMWTEPGWVFEVDRYTKAEFDQIAAKLEQMFIANERITLRSYRVLYDLDSGYIRHVFDCEAI